MVKGFDAEAPLHRGAIRRPAPGDARKWRVRFLAGDDPIEELSILSLRDGCAVLSSPEPPFDTLWIVSLNQPVVIERVREDE